MPELPEVETIRRDLLPLIGQRLVEITVFDERYLARTDLRAENLKPLRGQTLKDIHRKGKFLFLNFENHLALGFHLGLTGSLVSVTGSESSESSVVNLKHRVLSLDFERMGIIFSDQRKFGKVLFFTDESDYHLFLEKLGDDALEIDFTRFAEILRQAKKPLKALLLDQRKVSGLGNIYADEILFRAGIDPRRSAASLSLTEVEVLYRVMQTVLFEAIKHRGSTVRDYVDGFGQAGTYQEKHLVYGKYGRACQGCGTILQKTSIGGRTTSFCPRCQK